VDDHPIVRQGIVRLVNQEDDMEVVGEVGDGKKLVREIDRLKPDVLMLDISLGDRSGIEITKDIRISHPDLPILVLSMHSELLYAERALRAGARGYIMKDEATDKLVLALRRVLNGKIYLSDEMSSRMLDQMIEGHGEGSPNAVERLSNRELEVYEMIGHALSTREIAQKLSLSIKTVEAHRANLKSKLNLKNSVELLQHATLWLQSMQR
jgi:DNA-binding NarL/FixJ family response regulator